MIRCTHWFFLGVLVLSTGCSGSDGSTASDGDAGPGDMTLGTDAAPDSDLTADSGGPVTFAHAPCGEEDRVGSLEITLEDSFTSVQGQVYNGVVPGYVPMVSAEEGTCRLYRPRSLRCEPSCEVGTTCGEDGTCIPQPAAVSIGTITMHGLADPVELMAGPPVYYYTHRGELSHPAFAPGDLIHMTASGDGDVAAFELYGRGVEPLVIQAEALPLEEGTESIVHWTEPTEDSTAMVHLVLSIANHGGTPGRIECEVPDTGEFAFPMALTDALLNLGYSGFPAVWLTRRTVDSVPTSLGCVQFVVQSNAALDISIPGLVSCSDDDDCPEGQSCGPELSCVEAT